MGRKKLYKTTEEKKAAINRNTRTYYEKNKDRLRKARMEKYYESKEKNKEEL